MNIYHKQKGFTIVELLIVVVVIAVLVAITVAAFTGIQNRARDNRRAQDLSNIKKALLVYEAAYGGVRRSAGAGAYTAVTYSGWDASINPDWLAFLRAEHGIMPVDPTNTLTGTNPPAAGNFTYYYYCYAAGSGPLPATANVALGYHKQDSTVVQSNFSVSSCLI